MGPLSLVGQKTTLTVQMVESTTKTLLLMRRTIKGRGSTGRRINGFTYPHAASENGNTQRLMTLPSWNGGNGAFGEHGFNEAGVSMTSTVTTISKQKVLKKLTQ